MDKQNTIRILYEIYTMLVEMEKSQRNEDFPQYDLDKVMDKVKNHLDYFIEIEPS